METTYQHRKNKIFIRKYQINNVNITQTNEMYFLGITFDKRLSFNTHTDITVEKTQKCRSILHQLNNLQKNINLSTKRKIYLSLGRSIIENGSPALLNLSKQNTNKLEACQNNCLRTLLKTDYHTRTNELCQRAKIEKVYDRKLALAKKWFTTATNNPNNIINYHRYRYFPDFDLHKTPHYTINH